MVAGQANKMGLLRRIVMGVLMVSTPIEAALFGAGYTNLTTPRLVSFRPAMMQVGISSHWLQNDQLNFDMNANYALSRQFSLGMTLVSQKTVVFHAQAAMVAIPTFFDFRLGGGILNLSTDPDLATWDLQKGNQRYNFTEYMGVAMTSWGITLTGGVMKRRQATPSQSIQQNLAASLFWAIEWATPYGSLMMDQDGESSSMGVSFYLDDSTRLTVMRTDPIVADASNPSMQSAFGLYLRKEFSVFDELKNEFKAIKESINEYQVTKRQFDQELLQLKADLEQLRVSKEGVSSALNTFVKSYQPFEGESKSTEELYVNGLASFEFFQRAQTFYNQGAYYNAIQELKNGQYASPLLPIFPIQIGSIYYLLGDLTNALRYWQQGYALNPNHPELHKLPPTILDEIRQRAKKQGV